MTKELILALQSGNSQRFTGSPAVWRRLLSELVPTQFCVCTAPSAGPESNGVGWVGGFM